VHATARVATASIMPVLTSILVVPLAGYALQQASARQAFDLHRLEGRFRVTGSVVRDRLPTQAVLVTVWESGTVRYHAAREAVLWDSLDPAWLDRAITWLRAQGREPFILVERWEEPIFRQRFGTQSPVGNLDWPPRFDINRQVRIFAPADREAYFKGDSIQTEYVWQ
jgi:hypothetical protein